MNGVEFESLLLSITSMAEEVCELKAIAESGIGDGALQLVSR
jgi:hypothetical protein